MMSNIVLGGPEIPRQKRLSDWKRYSHCDNAKVNFSVAVGQKC